MEKANHTRYQLLAEKWREGTISAAEREEFDAWYYAGENQYQMPTDESMETVGERLFQQIAAKAGIQKKSRGVKRILSRVAIAASLILIAGAALYFYNSTHNSTSAFSEYSNDIAPGKMGATLTLASGKTIKLSEASNGQLAKEAGLTISKSADGQVVYSAATADVSENKINTLSTAKGQTYVLTLSDKTQVWLNAASSLTYSAALNEHGQRRVKLKGEAYFQVTKDKLHPFIVKAAGQEVEVLGTHFNVSAYAEDDAVRTTLLEGSVKVAANGSSRMLVPNQQSVLNKGILNVKNVDAEDVIAWKNGLFIFEVESLQSVMRKVARWYDVDVVYADDVDKNKLYFGSVSRYDNISKILETLEMTKSIHFKVEGRRITVMK